MMELEKIDFGSAGFVCLTFGNVPVPVLGLSKFREWWLDPTLPRGIEIPCASAMDVIEVIDYLKRTFPAREELISQEGKIRTYSCAIILAWGKKAKSKALASGWSKVSGMPAEEFFAGAMLRKDGFEDAFPDKPRLLNARRNPV